MVFSLSSHNVIQYLHDAGLCSSEDGASADSELPQSSKKNLNLLVKLASNCKLLVKQERCTQGFGSQEEFFNEWLFHELLNSFPILKNISAIESLVVHFDEDDSILVRRYLSEYFELDNFYRENGIFPEEIATAIGKVLGRLHCATFNRREYRDFIATAPTGGIRYQYYNPAQGIEGIGPEIFTKVPKEALIFYELYQHYDDLESEIAGLANSWNPSCLIHNDLKLENILLHSQWEQQDKNLVRFIDWEAYCWGDPTFELGTIIASYLKIWLESLVVDPSISLEESFQLAMVPLEAIQPSILALTRSYLKTFPKILEYHQEFILQVVQFAGLVLIKDIEKQIDANKSFDNIGLCTLEVARKMLTIPQISVMTVFGVNESEIIKHIKKLQVLPINKKENNLLPIFYEKTRLRGC